MAAPRERAPRVVAELGRPETPGETAARKAETSRRHRANQTLLNLVVALVASLAIVLFLVLVVVRPSQPAPPAVDYRAAAAQAQPGAKARLAAPDLPKGWSANGAETKTGADGIVTWTVGFITPQNQYIGLVQGVDANETWVSNAVEQSRSTGSQRLGGARWLVYDRRDASDVGNYAYSMSTTAEGSSFVLHGTASTKEFHTLASALLHQVGDDE